MKTIYDSNYELLVQLNIFNPNQPTPDYRRSISSPYMDLVVERLQHMDDIHTQGSIALSLAHYFEQNGDFCCDPDMVILVYPNTKQVEALTFQQAIPPIYSEVYPEPGKVNPTLKKDLNQFLETWLTNLVHQDHGKEWETESRR